MPRRRIIRRGRRAGATLIEVTLALAIAGIAAVVAAAALMERTNMLQARIVGQQFKVVADAAQEYIKDNHVALGSSVPNVGDRALIDSNSDGSSVDELVGAGYLPVGIDSNAWNQTYQIWLRRTSAEGLDGLLVSRGGVAPEAKYLAEAAIEAGGSAGFADPLDANCPSAANCTVLGLYGGWSTTLGTFRPGGAAASGPVYLAHVLTLNADTVIDDYLYRSVVPGHPEANEMETDVHMGGNAIDDIGLLRGALDAGTGEPNLTVRGDLSILPHDPDGPGGVAPVRGHVFVGDQTDPSSDQVIVVNSYLENTTTNAEQVGSSVVQRPSRSALGGTVNIPSNVHGNVWRYEINQNTTFVLPAYQDVGGAETVNSTTIVVRNFGAGTRGIRWSASGGSIDWGFGDGTGTNAHPDACTTNGDTHVYQFLRFKGTNTWYGQLVWQQC